MIKEKNCFDSFFQILFTFKVIMHVYNKKKKFNNSIRIRPIKIFFFEKKLD